MDEMRHWLDTVDDRELGSAIDGLVFVTGYQNDGPPEAVAIIEKAREYGADAVFFEARKNGRSPIPQAFIFFSSRLTADNAFAEVHKRLWSWGGVPLLYRKTRGLIQLFRCAHKADFVAPDGSIICAPVETLRIASLISTTEPWWDSSMLRNGTLWDDPRACDKLLSPEKSAQKQLIKAIEGLNSELNDQGLLRKHLRRRLLILSMLIAYLEEREVFPEGYFEQFLPGAVRFFEVLGNGQALVRLLEALEDRFNGHVFILNDADRDLLIDNGQLVRFARLVEGQQEENGQLTLWQLYSFRDLPVELISAVYQLFVDDTDSSVYTPPFVARLMLDEALSWTRLERFHANHEIILDPSCGSGVFLVEAYKRLVLHWRSKNDWKRPTIPILKSLLKRVHGVDLDEGAVEVAAFSLCLALCDALEPAEIRSSIKLFPQLSGKTLHHSCFFEALEKKLIKPPVGVIVGNPPFKASLTTDGARRSYERYQKTRGTLPDKQLAYLFLHESMQMIAEGGVLSMLQQYNLLYNIYSGPFRKAFFADWDVREILDLVSVRGLFKKGGKDTKVVVCVAEASKPPADRKVLHATFRRSGRTDAGQGFDIDYYDLHWHSRQTLLQSDTIWRADLLGGGRVADFVNRLKRLPTLADYAASRGWDFGEGFIEGRSGSRLPAEHLTGKHFIPSDAITANGVDYTKISSVEATLFKTAYTSSRYSPPMILIREQMDLDHTIWTESYLTYKNKVVGICAQENDLGLLRQMYEWISQNIDALKAFAAAISVRMFTQKATTLSEIDILSLPYPESRNLDLSENEQIIVDDIVRYFSDFVRLGEASEAMAPLDDLQLSKFNNTLKNQVNDIYSHKPLNALQACSWPGVVCQPYCFGNSAIVWNNADSLRNHIRHLVQDPQNGVLNITRVARIYDENFVFLLKPNRLRYWLRSVALRDADEIITDLRAQEF